MKKEIIINKNKYNFEVIQNRDDMVSFHFNGKDYQFHKQAESEHAIILADDHLNHWIPYANSNAVILNKDIKIQSPNQSRTDVGGTVAAGNMLSPMPGKILKVLVAKGDDIKIGDPIIVMEAMKMEHTIKANGNGTVESIYFNEGDLVEGDVELIHINCEE